MLKSEEISNQLLDLRNQASELGKKIHDLEYKKEKIIEKERKANLDLPITLAQDVFVSLEGESLRAGSRVVFVRFQGCNLRCQSSVYPECHCDSEYSFKDSPTTVHYTIRTLIDKIKTFNCKNIAITGGEPLLHKDALYWLLHFLSTEEWCDFHRSRFSDYKITIETNGSLDFGWVTREFGSFVSIIGDWKCPTAFGTEANSKMLVNNLSEYRYNDALKFVITREDFTEVKKILDMSGVDKRTNVYLSPCWGAINIGEVADWTVDHPEYNLKLSVQLHKLFGVDMKELLDLPSAKKSIEDIWV